MTTPKIVNYWRPTPIFWRKIGDSLLAVGTLAGTVVISEGYEWIGTVLVLCSVAGKFLTNFFKES